MKSAPFARTIEDKELNATLKEQEYWDDPMRVKSKQSSTSSNIGQQGKRQLQGPPNRYNIPPGPQWDGVGKFLMLKHLKLF